MLSKMVWHDQLQKDNRGDRLQGKGPDMLSNTDGQSHKQIPLYHIPMGMGDIFFSIQISTFSLTVFACSLCFVQDKLM